MNNDQGTVKKEELTADRWAMVSERGKQTLVSYISNGEREARWTERN